MNRPIIWITIAFSLGIALAKNVPLPVWFVFLSVLIFFFISICALWQKLNLKYFILILTLLTGFLSFQLSSLPKADSLANCLNQGYLTIRGQVDDKPKQTDKGLSFPLQVDGGVISVWLSGSGEVEYGDRVEVRGVISELEGLANPLMPEARKTYKLNTSYVGKISSGGGQPLKKSAIWFSQKFNSVLMQILPAKEAALLGSILLGTSVSPIDYETKDSFRRAGIIHLLVASGTQVSILIGVCLSLMRMCRLPNWLAILITSLFNLMLVIVTGGGASILRAAIMGEIMLLGLLFDRQGEIYTTLSLSALILLIVNPATLFDLGFQLSFAATWALVYIAPVLEKKMPALLAVTLAPLLATTPISAYNMSQVSPGGIISNLLVISFVEFLTIFGFLTTVIGLLCLPLAGLLANTLWLLLASLEKIVAIVPALPGACFYIAAPSFVIIAAYYAGLVMVIEKMRREEKIRLTKKRLAFAFLILFSVFVWDRASSNVPLGGQQLTVTFIDVGQGDSVLIETPGGKKILIDGGGKESGGVGDRGLGIGGSGDQVSDPIGEKVVVPFLHRKGINRLDMVILTHPHADHLGGLNKVIEEIAVDEVLDSGQVFDSLAYKRFKDLVRANQVKYSLGRAGQVVNFGNNLTGYILNPFEPLLGDANSDSIVMRLVYGDVSFLLTGDLGNSGEERVLNYPNSVLSSTVLKVGHHGSATSTLPEFLAAIQPKFAVIPVGAHNRYRHPAKSTLEKLQAAGIKTYRTDENGAVIVTTNGKEVRIEAEDK